MVIRFVGVVRTLERILEVWECLVELYDTHYGKVFPLPDKEVVKQLMGLLSYVKDVQVHSQTRKYPVSCTTLLMMLDLDHKHLHEHASIEIKGSVSESFSICPLVQKTRSVLLPSIDKRY